MGTEETKNQFGEGIEFERAHKQETAEEFDAIRREYTEDLYGNGKE
jgi:hypothetical protein